MEILDGQGWVILEDSYGDDLTIVNAARQSFAQRSDSMGEKEIGLINFLLKNRHGTPFEMVDFRFNIKVPIAVAREWHRHRIASYNEMSGRYKELPNEFYVPPIECIRTQVGKPGSYHYKIMDPNIAINIQDEIIKAYEKAWDTYKSLLKKGVAKEQARLVLPVGIMTQFTYKTNLRALLNFISLRSDSNAMEEIREASKMMEMFIKRVVPYTWNSFVENGRVAP